MKTKRVESCEGWELNLKDMEMFSWMLREIGSREKDKSKNQKRKRSPIDCPVT